MGYNFKKFDIRVGDMITEFNDRRIVVPEFESYEPSNAQLANAIFGKRYTNQGRTWINGQLMDIDAPGYFETTLQLEKSGEHIQIDNYSNKTNEESKDKYSENQRTNNVENYGSTDNSNISNPSEASNISNSESGSNLNYELQGDNHFIEHDYLTALDLYNKALISDNNNYEIAYKITLCKKRLERKQSDVNIKSNDKEKIYEQKKDLSLTLLWIANYGDNIKSVTFSEKMIAIWGKIWYETAKIGRNLRYQPIITEIDLNNGNILWETNIGSGGEATKPDLNSNTVAAGLDNPDNSLFWFDVNNRSDVKQMQLTSYVRADPIIYKEFIIIGTDDGLFCINMNNNSINWHKTFGDWIREKPYVIDNNYIYVGSKGGLVRKINIQSGNIDWENKLNADIFATPYFYKNSIVLCLDNYLGEYNGKSFEKHPSEIVSLNIFNGRINWRTKTEYSRGFGEIVGCPELEMIFMCYSSLLNDSKFHSIIYGFSFNTGEVIWKFQSEYNQYDQIPLISGNYLLICDGNKIKKLNARTGKEETSAQLTKCTNGYMKIIGLKDDILYLNDNKNIYAYK
jgi:hypothetical protein